MSAFNHRIGQVTYPRMERQDLTQSQLGSFKFTPTDEVRHMFTAASPRLAPEFTCTSMARSATIKSAPHLQSYASGHDLQTPGTFISRNPPSRFDPDFFNTYIRPDITGSRLRLGPNALRIAVDGSPTGLLRRSLDTDAFDRACYRAMAQPNIPEQNGSYASTNLNGGSSSVLNPVTSGFAQIELNVLHASLIRALANEQQAHQATKDALEIEKELRLKAETEAQKHLNDKHTLRATNNMLKSLVRHSREKEQDAAKLIDYESVQPKANPEQPQPTILYDAVKNLRERASKVADPPQIDNNDLYNFDLVETHGSLALRRHFSPVPEQIRPEPADKANEDDQLINLSPLKAAKHEKSVETRESSDETVNSAIDKTSLEDANAVLQTKSENLPSPKHDAPEKLMVMPFDPHVQWCGTLIFNSDEEKVRAIGHYSTIFSQHPVRYQPNKSDKNLYRTIMMDFIPNDTTVREVLDTIRGGTVESIQLVGPIGQSTDFKTARIVFNYELGARTVYMQGQNPGITIRGKKVRVWQVLEATYPRTKDFEREVFEDGYTRLLAIQNAPETSLSKLPQKLARQVQAGNVVEITKTHDGLPMIEFTSIAESSRALHQLVSDADFGGCSMDFEADPCNDLY